MLVGIVERVSNYAGIGACGFLTHFSAVSGVEQLASAPAGTTRQASEPRRQRVAGKASAGTGRQRANSYGARGRNGAGDRAVPIPDTAFTDMR